MSELATSILAVGRIVGGVVHWRIAPLPLMDDDVDALIDEVMGKPGLGIEDSAGLFDFDGELEDQIEGRLDNEFHARGGW